MSVIAYFHQWIPNPMATLYYVELFLLYRGQLGFRFRFRLESELEPVEKSCIVQEFVSVSKSDSDFVGGNKP